MHDDEHNDRALWLAVIKQHMDDAVTTGDGVATKRNRRDARQWLTDDNRGFREVCALAGLEPDQVRAAALERIAVADGERPARPVVQPAPKPVPVSKAPVRPLATLRPRPPLTRQRTPMQRSRRLTHDGISLTLPEWAERLGVGRTALQQRLAKGWPLARVLSEPISEGARKRRATIARRREAREAPGVG